MMAKRLQAATAHLTPPFAVVDLDELDDNANINDHQSCWTHHSTSDEVDPMPGDHQSCAWAKGSAKRGQDQGRVRATRAAMNFSEFLDVDQEAARRDSVPSFMLRPRLTSVNHKVISR